MTRSGMLPVLDDDPDRPWSDPAVLRVADGVHRIPLPLPGDALRAVNVYVVADGDDVLLVDAGQVGAGAHGVLTDGLAALGHGPQAVRRILVTHVHRDHFTLAVQWRREHGSEVALGIGEQDSLRTTGAAGPPHAAQIVALRRCGAGDLADLIAAGDGRDDLPRDIWEEPDRWLTDGVTVAAGGRDLQALSTPGHTHGHLVFRDAGNGLLFAGDHVLPHITPSIGLEAVRVPNPLRDYLGALRRVRALPDTRLLPAHGHVLDGTHERIDALLEHHADRLAATEHAVRTGRDTSLRVAAGLGWTRHERRLDELDPFNRMLAVLETEAHLELLVTQGRLVSEEIDGVRHYRVR